MSAVSSPQSPAAQTPVGPAGAHAVEADTTEVVGRRIGAALIDGLLFLAAFVVVGIATGHGHSGNGHASVTVGPTGSVVILIFGLAYFFICESVWGQTLGKRLLHIRVLAADGSRPGAGRVFVRTLLRVVDVLPFAYIVGLIAVLASGRARRQRLGDLAGGTVVRAA